MKELTTDKWQLLLPDEWVAEQNDETIVITDPDEVSIIELTTLQPEEGESVSALMQSLADNTQKVELAGRDARYQEVIEDGQLFREWFCELDDAVLIISHGVEEEHKGMADAIVDEILATIVF